MIQGYTVHVINIHKYIIGVSMFDSTKLLLYTDERVLNVLVRQDDYQGGVKSDIKCKNRVIKSLTKRHFILELILYIAQCSR